MLKAHVYSLNIPERSADCTIYTPGIGRHSCFTVSSPLSRIQHLSKKSNHWTTTHMYQLRIHNCTSIGKLHAWVIKIFPKPSCDFCLNIHYLLDDYNFVNMFYWLPFITSFVIIIIFLSLSLSLFCLSLVVWQSAWFRTIIHETITIPIIETTNPVGNMHEINFTLFQLVSKHHTSQIMDRKITIKHLPKFLC